MAFSFSSSAILFNASSSVTIFSISKIPPNMTFSFCLYYKQYSCIRQFDFVMFFSVTTSYNYKCNIHNICNKQKCASPRAVHLCPKGFCSMGKTIFPIAQKRHTQNAKNNISGMPFLPIAHYQNIESMNNL